MSLCVFRLAVGREPHHLVFAGVDLEAGVIGERRIKQAERMREVDLLEDLERVAVARSPPTSSPIRRRRPWSAPRPLRTARDRTPMPHGSDDVRRTTAWPVSKSSSNFFEFLAQQVLLEQLLPQPERDRHLEGAEAARRQRDIGFQQPLEFQERLVVEDDVIDVGKAGAGGFQAIGDRVASETTASCFLRVKRSSCAAATMRPSSTSAAALSW